MSEKKRRPAWRLIFLIFMLFLSGCGIAGKNPEKKAPEENTEFRNMEISSRLIWQESMKLEYAEQFSVDGYEGGYMLISAADGRKYLVVPEGKSVPEDLSEEIIVLKRPVNHIYLVATAVMDMFCELDALESIRFSGQKADGWCMREVQEEMESGNILYAGKYDAPDYEQIVSEGCSLAVENNMISHSPEVLEKLKDFGIPVLIDLSSYENHPLGRVEWIKLYGALLGKEEEAQAAFERQVHAMEEASGGEASGKTAAFFFITANGMVNVRVSSDYIPKMIETAGGSYIFENLGETDSRRSSMTMQMEEFYLAARDADYLIYNSTIDGEMESVEELLQKDGLLEDFKAVQEGNVWCTSRNLYQQSMSIGQMTKDIHNILSGDAERQKEVQYLYHLK